MREPNMIVSQGIECFATRSRHVSVLYTSLETSQRKVTEDRSALTLGFLAFPTADLRQPIDTPQSNRI